jgi:hypothetical protein
MSKLREYGSAGAVAHLARLNFDTYDIANLHPWLIAQSKSMNLLKP